LNTIPENNPTPQNSTLIMSELNIDKLEACLINLRDVFRRHQMVIKGKYNVSTVEMDIIQLIALEGQKKMKDIGESFNIKFSTLTSIVDKIEGQKLVKRVNSKTDRRSVYLTITPKGQALYENYKNYIHVIAMLMQRTIAPENFDIFVSEFEKITSKSATLNASAHT